MIILLFLLLFFAGFACGMDSPEIPRQKRCLEKYTYTWRPDSSSYIYLLQLHCAWEKKEKIHITPEKLNALGCDGQAVIHHAIQHFLSGEFLEHLITAGANVNMPSHYEVLPLHFAYCKKHTEAILVLERHKAVRFLQS